MGRKNINRKKEVKYRCEECDMEYADLGWYNLHIDKFHSEKTAEFTRLWQAVCDFYYD